ncbi:3-hydroxyacyl-ACP dehydratase FabZ family protein [Brevifollis gellanilyticus]|uniref:3-hydroxyacyl-[acyl-carrier-protein] dehydratase FabZ n=1 Tax=Brevifollis gellanilyticus TaxID=748831 RepID=A0A512M4P7_9BACT|nr:3-hydroxyacyl-ACP dehydratase FabZ family protein [Brevifollis gellanilyticus]GEP41311.1 3-hydroxyacyl-[acyl-carrier-protein] dehydratase FabZ [Brevifollis gellanilyticus]
MSQPADLFQALSCLPHGPSFRFVDEITELVPGQSATGRWTLKGDEAFLTGHFPGQPILPGVIMIESLAQLGGVLAQSDRGDNPLKNLRLTAVRQFKILGTIPPGQTLTLQVRRDAVMPGLVQISGEILTADGAKIASGSIILSGEE